jgi:adenine-specific DNA-methyltransferase
VNYIGSKLSLRAFLAEVYYQVADGTEKVFVDLFAGTGAVGRHFQQLGFQVIANDLQYYAYVLNKAHLAQPQPLLFAKLREEYRHQLNQYQIQQCQFHQDQQVSRKVKPQVKPQVELQLGQGQTAPQSCQAQLFANGLTNDPANDLANGVDLDLADTGHITDIGEVVDVNNLASINQPLMDIFYLINAIPGVTGFISENYSPLGQRNYFTVTNAQKIDAIRQRLEHWRLKQLITAPEYFYLLCCLIEAADKVANTACVYEAFLKQFKKTALKPLQLAPLPLVTNRAVLPGQVYQQDANELIKVLESDILYLDPPYNGRQYSSNYHLLDTIALYDQPAIKGITGMRTDYQRSRYCQKRQVKTAFSELIAQARTKHILLSYNDEGLLSKQDICDVLSLRGKPRVFQIDYNRFKADNTRDYKRQTTVEFVYYVRVS